VKRAGKFVIGVIAALGGIYAILFSTGFVFSRLACQTEEKLKIDDPSGLRFELEYTNCDLLAKDEAISVYAEKILPTGPWFFSSWRNQRTLIFRYDPEREDSPLPSITRPSQSTILISIPEVSSILYQNRAWANMSVNYDIRRVTYPAASK
jgi:hypothetical protein